MTARLAWTELKLLAREPLVLVVSLLFPILLMVLLLASFSEDELLYAGLPATEFYVTSYLSAAVAVMGFMGMPTHLASYRGSGVLRRFRAAGLPAASLVLSQVAVMAALAVVGSAAMLALAAAGFSLAAPVSAAGVAIGLAAGIAGFAGIGVLFGSVMQSARAAQGVGLLLFFGTFFIAGGGPPPDLLPDALNDTAAVTPIGLLIDAIRTPWADGNPNLPALLALVVIAVLGFALATRRLARS